MTTDIDTIRDALGEADFTLAGIGRAGIDLGLGVRSADIAVLERALEPVEPLATLIRLFVLGSPVSVSAATERLGADVLRAIADENLAETAGEVVGPLIRLTPWRGLVIAHDPDPAGDLWPEHVSGPTPAADALIRLVTPNGGAALDLGTGSGLLGAALAGGQRTVVATDINPAAIRLARLTAGLNGLANVEVVEGDLFEPVTGRSFDLIVADPPFVISPETDLLFRHSPFARDELSREVVRSAAAHLTDGGFAYLLVNWVQEPGADWLEVLGDWLAETGCDAIGLLHGIDDPLSYAVRWTGREQYLRPARHGETLDRWLAHFRDAGIAAVGTGALILRRRSGANWIHGLPLSGETRGEAGAQIQAMFAARDRLAASPDPARRHALVLESAFRIEAPHRLAQSLVNESGEYVVEPASLVLDEGLGTPTTIDPDLIPVILRLDGSQVVGDIAREVAEATGADVDAVSRRSVAIVRELFERGVAIPVDMGG